MRERERERTRARGKEGGRETGLYRERGGERGEIDSLNVSVAVTKSWGGPVIGE